MTQTPRILRRNAAHERSSSSLATTGYKLVLISRIGVSILPQSYPLFASNFYNTA